MARLLIWLSYLLFIFSICTFAQNDNPATINIGLLFEENDPVTEKVFEKAVLNANVELAAHSFSFVNVNEQVPPANPYITSKKLCKILRTGVIAVFGSLDKTSSTHAMALCDAKEVPFLDTHWDPRNTAPSINLHPEIYKIGHVLRDIVVAFGWNGFTILYESGPYLPMLDNLLQLYDSKGSVVTVRKYDLDLQDNYRHVLRRIKKSGDKRIVIVGSKETLPELLKQAQEVGLLNEHYQFIIGNLDLQTIDLESFQHSDANITNIRIVNPENEKVKDIVAYLNQDLSTDAPPKDIAVIIPITAALISDGVLLLAEALKHIRTISGDTDVFTPSSLNCKNDDTWKDGLSLVNFMKTTSVHGITGDVKFDHRGVRSDFLVEVVELTPLGLTKIGNWNTSMGLHIERISTVVNNFDDRSLRNKSFIVLTALSDPYGMLKDSSAKLHGNERFEGFGIDLIQELSQELGFNYTFKLQEDKVYGSYNRETGSWNGMIREIMEDRADLAITDLTMTSDRENAVDFTIPFMNLGISILYRKPTPEQPKLFSFMSPFSNEVWLYLGAAYIGVSLSLFILGRLSPAEWDNPYPCIEEPTMLENQFTIRNSFWFTVGALLQQGSEIAPKAPSTRTVASIWWFFTLIMVSSYTANLAAFLVVVSLYSPVNSVEDLANQNGGVKYGAKRDGSTINFFKEAKDPTYAKMGEFMKEHPELLTSSNDEGLNRVKSENYAFLMESTSIEYIVERHCEVTQIGNPLDEKGYGIAMKKNSPYRDALSQAMLRLQEGGVLDKLKVKWWKEKRGGGACADSGDDSGALALEVANLGGVFLLLVLGCVAAIVISFIEMIVDIAQKARENKIPFKELFMEEMKFVLKCSGNTKEVKNLKASSEDTRHSSLTLRSSNSESSEHIGMPNGKGHVKRDAGSVKD